MFPEVKPSVHSAKCRYSLCFSHLHYIIKKKKSKLEHEKHWRIQKNFDPSFGGEREKERITFACVQNNFDSEPILPLSDYKIHSTLLFLLESWEKNLSKRFRVLNKQKCVLCTTEKKKEEKRINRIMSPVFVKTDGLHKKIFLQWKSTWNWLYFQLLNCSMSLFNVDRVGTLSLLISSITPLLKIAKKIWKKKERKKEKKGEEMIGRKS